MRSARTRITALVALALLTAACSKTGGTTAEHFSEEPPATARDGAPVFRVPADADAAIGRAGLRVLDGTDPVLLKLRAHLDVFINGHAVVVPKGIGVVDDKRASPLTTRDDSGVLHVGSPRKDETFRLGRFFQQWNVTLDKDCIAAFCMSTNPDKQLLAFVDGELAADPSTIHLVDGIEIVVWYGDRDTNPKVPAAYAFGA
jgi:hypothetical protein